MLNPKHLFLLYHNMTINEKIRSIRQSKGYTQEYIADKLSIDAVNYGRIERGQANLSVERLMAICEILKISPALLFRETHDSGGQYDDILNKIYREIQLVNNKLNSLL